MSVIIQDNFSTAAAKPTDARYGPYNNVAAAQSAIPEVYRYKGLTVGILNSGVVEEYWWANGVTDPDLVQKTATGNVTGITQGTGIIVDNTNPQIPDISVDTAYVQVVSNLSTSVPTDGTSDVKYPSVKAVKDYADGLVVGLLNDRGNWAAGASPGAYPTNPPATGSGPAGAILKGDIWFISTNGFLGTTAVSIGASVRALVDSPSPSTDADWDIIDAGLGFTPENVTNKVSTGANVNADPTSTSKYPSVNALVEYVTNYSPTPTTPDLQTVTGAGYTTSDPIQASSIGFIDPTFSNYAVFYCETVGLGSRIRLDDSFASPRLSLDTAGTDLTVWANTGSTQAILDFASVSGTQTYTFPNATGTVALTSDITSTLSSYVPYTGATNNIDLGIYGINGLDGSTNTYSVLPAGLSFSDTGFSSSVSIDKVSVTCSISSGHAAINVSGTPQVGAYSSGGYAILTLDTGGEGLLAFNNGLSISSIKCNNVTAGRTLQLPDSTGTLLTTVSTSAGPLTTGVDGNVTIPDADASTTGLITTGSQIIEGAKTFTSNLAVEQIEFPILKINTTSTTLNGISTLGYPSIELKHNSYSGYLNTGIVGEIALTDNASLVKGLIQFRKTSSTYANLVIFPSVTTGNNVLIGTSTDSGNKLHVEGTTRVTTSLQTPIVRGNTTASGTLTLQSTSSGTKGKILFGTSAYDEASNALGIGTSTPDASAKVQIDSTTQGFLPPRMTSLQRGNILSPAVGLMVYQTDDDLDAGKPKGVYVYDGTTWRRLNWT